MTSSQRCSALPSVVGSGALTECSRPSASEWKLETNSGQRLRACSAAASRSASSGATPATPRWRNRCRRTLEVTTQASTRAKTTRKTTARTRAGLALVGLLLQRPENLGGGGADVLVDFVVSGEAAQDAHRVSARRSVAQAD